MANRILKGKHGGSGSEDLHALITVASMGPFTDSSVVPVEPGPVSARAASTSAGRAHAEAESVSREAMLTAFRESAAAWESGAGQRRTGGGTAAQKSVQKTARKAVGGRAAPRALVLRFATAVLLVCGVGVAAASAGVLPTGMQRIAHEYLGIGGVSAPSTQVPASSAAAGGLTKGSSGSRNSNSAAAPSAVIGAAPKSTDIVVALCQRISQGRGSSWQSGLSTADQATLIAAAGNQDNVKDYCGRLLAGTTGKGHNTVPSPAATNSHGPAATGKPSSAPSVGPDEPRGKAHPSHSAAAHGGAG